MDKLYYIHFQKFTAVLLGCIMIVQVFICPFSQVKKASMMSSCHLSFIEVIGDFLNVVGVKDRLPDTAEKFPEAEGESEEENSENEDPKFHEVSGDEASLFLSQSSKRKSNDQIVKQHSHDRTPTPPPKG